MTGGCDRWSESPVALDGDAVARVAELPDAARPFYYHEGMPVELELDPTRLVVEVSHQATVAQLADRARAAALQMRSARPLSQAAGHWLLQLSEGTPREAVLRATDNLRTSAGARFVGNAYRARSAPLMAYEDEGIVLINRLVVRFKDGTSRSEIERLNGTLGTRILREPQPDSGRFVFWLSYPPAGDPLRVAATYDRHPLVEYADPDKVGDWRLTGPASDPLYGSQYYLKNPVMLNGVRVDINIEPAWELTKGGGIPSAGGITVAVLDDGVEGNHEDFGSHVDFGFDVFGHNEFDCPTECARFPFGDDSHGTQVAGIILGQHDNGQGVAGAAPDAFLTPIRISRADSFASDADIASAINIAWNVFRADVISNSWGRNPAFPSNDITAAINNATTQGRGGLGTAVVFAAGNTSARAAGIIGPVLYPGNLASVITVGAINRNGGLSDYTAEGSALDIVAPSSHFTGVCTRAIDGPGDLVTIDLANVRGCNDGPNDEDDYTAEFGGTSAAAPQVAAAFALLYSVEPELTLSQARSRVLGSTHPWPGTSAQVGNGKLNVAAALGIPPPPPPPPPFTVSIDGPSPVQPFSSCLYQALTQSGTPPFSYAWKADGVPVGSDSPSYRHNAGTSSFVLEVIVTDAGAQGASGSMSVTVDAGAPECLDTRPAP
jgi:subtilisin family serine protease